jgi:hypothetical protein
MQVFSKPKSTKKNLFASKIIKIQEILWMKKPNAKNGL